MIDIVIMGICVGTLIIVLMTVAAVKNGAPSLCGAVALGILVSQAMAWSVPMARDLNKACTEIAILRKACLDAGIAKMTRKNVVLSETNEFELISTATAELPEKGS